MNIQIQSQINKSPLKITLFLLLLFSNRIFSNTTNQLDVEIHIPKIQKITIIDQLQFDKSTNSELNQGFQILEGCLELEIKSNTNWSLLAYNEDIENKNFQIKISSSSIFTPLSVEEIQIQSSSLATNSTLISIDCKRNVSWNNQPLQKWSFSPIFSLKTLE